MKTGDLDGALLDYWTARAEGMNHETATFAVPAHAYSTEWAHGGPIIERERIALFPYRCESFNPKREPSHIVNGGYQALIDVEIGNGEIEGRVGEIGQTALIAAMRAYVASRFGDTVPDEPRAG